MFLRNSSVSIPRNLEDFRWFMWESVRVSMNSIEEAENFDSLA